MKKPWQYLTKADVIISVGLLLLAVLGTVWSIVAPSGQIVVVSNGERLLYHGALDWEGTIPLQGPLGTTELEIDQSGARITAAPCPLKICMRMGPAKQRGDILVCVPNRILVQIEGDAPEAAHYDLLSR